MIYWLENYTLVKLNINEIKLFKNKIIEINKIFKKIY
jgi:hypothetical protein